ncbi:hypothetical protein FQN53_007951 [Emmonsiellopsis sp. PD_33]|nr:hypothetical protein FQN53_007951 [Emmonsiellopsis sp. PD_33]
MSLREPSVKLEPDDNALGFYLDNPNESNLRNIGEYYPSQEPDDPNSILPQPMASYQPVNPNPNQTVGPYPQIPGVPEPGFPAFTNEPGPYFAGNQDQTRTMLQQPHPNYPSVQPGATMRQYVPPRLNRQPQQHPQDVDYSRLVYNDIQEPRIPQQSQRYQQTHPQQPQPQVHHQPTQNRPNKTAGGNSHRQPRPPFDSMENTKHQHPG